VILAYREVGRKKTRSKKRTRRRKPHPSLLKIKGKLEQDLRGREKKGLVKSLKRVRQDWGKKKVDTGLHSAKEEGEGEFIGQASDATYRSRRKGKGETGNMIFSGREGRKEGWSNGPRVIRVGGGRRPS